MQRFSSSTDVHQFAYQYFAVHKIPHISKAIPLINDVIKHYAMKAYWGVKMYFHHSWPSH
jgi:hypothetical protein